MYVSNVSYLPCSLLSIEKSSSFVREYSLIEMLKWISSTCDVGVSCWAHVLLLLRSLSIVKDISHGNGTSILSSSVLSSPAAVGSSRWTVNVYDALEIVYQVREQRRCQRTVIKCHLKHKWSRWSQQGGGERGDLAGNGLISYCVATCAFCSYDWIFNSICCTNISTSLPPFPSPFLSILLRAKSLRCWQTFLF